MANAIANPNRIRIGQVLQEPDRAATRDIKAYRQLGTWADTYDFGGPNAEIFGSEKGPSVDQFAFESTLGAAFSSTRKV